jgi:integrase
VRAADVSRCVAAIADEVGTATANKARRMLFGAFKRAVKWRMVAWNPVEAVDPLCEEPRPTRIWSSHEAATFIAHAAGHRLFAAFYLMMVGGLRRGEVLGLEWGDISDGRIHVRRSLTVVRNELTVSTPKTNRGARIVTLADDALQVLDTHRCHQEVERADAGEAWERGQRVFTTEIDGPITPMMLSHAFVRIQEQAGVTRVRLHDLRRLHVSLLVREGLDPRTIADRIGHSDPAFTLRRYSHMFEEQRAAAALNLSELLRQSHGPVS